MAKQKRRIYCRFCDFFCYTPEDFVSHLEKHHDEMIPEDMDGWQFSYYLRTGKTHGNCVMCKKPTTWNNKTHKYNRFCNNPKCKEKYREIFKKRMIGRYGKTTLLNDPEQQKKMLANRKISGKYLWRDHVHETPYTGSYEKNFLEFLDVILNFDPEDVMAPSPHTYYYIYQGEKHFYIPDFFIPSLGLEIEIKDGGDNANKHPKIQAVDKVKEKLKDEVMTKNHFSYIKIVNKENEKFLSFLNQAKENYFNDKHNPIYMTEKELTLDDLNDMYMSIFENANDSNSLYEESDKISFSKSFSDVKKIVDALSKSDLNRICNGTFKDSPYVIYRDVLSVNNKPVSFIDVYRLPDMKEDGVIVLATNPDYRKLGYSSILVNRMHEKLKDKKLIWKTQKDNNASINLAKKMNYNPIYEDASVMEACKSPKEARELTQKVKELAKEYDANFYFVTDGASATSNSGNPAVKVARDAVAKWERKNGYDDKEDWTNNPDDFSNYMLKKGNK